MKGYSKEELNSLRDFYRSSLLDDTLEFWMPEIVDQEFGGYLSMRDRDGSLIDDDKSVWLQGRFAWMLATLCNTVEMRPEWLAAAKSGVAFLKEHCFDEDGRMFFLVTRDGRPLRKRRYYFSEAFAAMAFAAYGKASGEIAWLKEARRLFAKCMDYSDGKELAGEPKWTGERETKGIGVPMIFLQVAQVLVANGGDDCAERKIDELIEEIREFVKDDIECVMEQIGVDGEVVDHIDARTLNPGHAIEGAWFILDEAKRRGGDPELVKLGCRMLDYMWKWGWDEKHGGIFYFRDVFGKPVQEYWHDMKFWWPQCEAIIATLLAYEMTGDPKYAEWHAMIHRYAHEKFPDGGHGEWFGYLHRDGEVSSEVKGNHFKGPFHLPRMQWYCWQLLERWGERRFFKS
ncbi:AGE family epimerase/isomerase [Verrucomicrobiaceae bacterium 227]